MITEEVRLQRLERVMMMHRLGYATRLIKKRCHMQVHDAVKLARKLGVPWTGKPIKERVCKHLRAV